uniref:Uncharacterized protein n=1 Tax=Glossina morsitans morsitans TaxID=37546 RepID=A0A1B0FIU0_GLOMM
MCRGGNVVTTTKTARRWHRGVCVRRQCLRPRAALTAGEHAIVKTLTKAKKQNVELAKSQFALDATKLPIIGTKR